MDSNRLYIGVKISRNLEKELDNPAPGTEGYLRPDHPNHLQVVNWKDVKLIGRNLRNGFPLAEISKVGGEISEILMLIIPGHRVHEHLVHIYLLDETSTSAL